MLTEYLFPPHSRASWKGVSCHIFASCLPNLLPSSSCVAKVCAALPVAKNHGCTSAFLSLLLSSIEMVAHSLIETSSAFSFLDPGSFSSLTLLCPPGQSLVFMKSCLFSVLPLKVCDTCNSVLNPVFFSLYTLLGRGGMVLSSSFLSQTLFLNSKPEYPVGL